MQFIDHRIDIMFGMIEGELDKGELKCFIDWHDCM